MKHIPVVILLLAGAGTEAQATARSYSLPTDEGKAISDCLADGKGCGKPAADQFCKKAGYSESILFSRAPVTLAQVLDSTEVCAGETCKAFTRIKCYAPKAETQASAQ
jgi:hypothetical protein